MIQSGGGGTILILEDDEGVALLERRRLERAGFDVAVATTPDEARERLERRDIDLLVLDYKLDSSISGLEFHRRLATLGLDVPSILVTGFGDEATLTEAMRGGIRDFLPKTTDYLDFLAPTVGRVLQQVRTERQLADSRGELAALAERSKHEQALREAQERLRLMIDSVRDYAIFALDPDGRIANWNAGAERLFGYTEAEVLGRPFDLLYSCEDREAAVPASIVVDAVESGRVEDERWHLRKNGSRFFSSGIITSMTDAGGRLAGFTKIARDVTERRQAEQTLRANEAALKESDRRKNEFLAMLAHELRNPLSAVIGALDVSRMKEVTADDRVWADEVMGRQLKHLTHLIDDLLDVSRISKGKIQLRVSTLELGSILERALETSRPLIEDKRHALIVSLPEKPTYLDADPTRLEQIVVNLLTNAAKYTDPGGRIRLSAGTVSDSNEVFVRVEDNGVGIPVAMQAGVFELFTQMERSLDRSQGGLGIGLTLVQTLTKMHGGRIELESEGVPGKGSRFTVRLPISNRTHPVTPNGPTLEPASPPLKSRRVLIVDDNDDIARALSRLLRTNGYEVRVVNDGEAALREAEVFQPEIFLLDLGLPKIDGFQVAQTLRQDHRFDQATIIAISGYGQPQDRIRAENAGFDHHLIKPVDFDALETLILEISRRIDQAFPKAESR